MWAIDASELTYDDPVYTLGKGTFGLVLRGYYRGTTVAVKKAISSEKPADSGLRMSHLPSAQSFTRGRKNSFNVARSSSVGGKVNLDASERGAHNEYSTQSLCKLKNMFIEEMRKLAKLRHPYIVTIMGAVTHGDEPLLVMECMTNGSLHALLHNETLPLDSELVLPMLRDILQGMRFLHAAAVPIIHGDLKSANVLVDSNFRAKVSDFGLSQKRKSGHIGTPYWMAPELLMGGHVSTAGDIYAFGVTLWELMTRKSPYADLDIPHVLILQQITEGTLRPDCSKGLKEELALCMQQCWNHNPHERPTFEELDIKLIPLCGHNFYTSARRNQETNTKYRRDSAALLHTTYFRNMSPRLLRTTKRSSPRSTTALQFTFRTSSDLQPFPRVSQPNKCRKC